MINVITLLRRTSYCFYIFKPYNLVLLNLLLSQSMARKLQYTNLDNSRFRETAADTAYTLPATDILPINSEHIGLKCILAMACCFAFCCIITGRRSSHARQTTEFTDNRSPAINHSSANKIIVTKPRAQNFTTLPVDTNIHILRAA